MGFFILAIVVGSSIWVLQDARAIGVKKGQLRGMANMDPGDWFICCLLLWIVVFPYYLSKRPQLLNINGKTHGLFKFSGGSAALMADGVDALEKLATLRDKGILTDMEFQMQKAKILGIPASSPAEQVEEISCPICNNSIPASVVQPGENTCPKCKRVFVAE